MGTLLVGRWLVGFQLRGQMVSNLQKIKFFPIYFEIVPTLTDTHRIVLTKLAHLFSEVHPPTTTTTTESTSTLTEHNKPRRKNRKRNRKRQRERHREEQLRNVNENHEENMETEISEKGQVIEEVNHISFIINEEKGEF